MYEHDVSVGDVPQPVAIVYESAHILGRVLVARHDARQCVHHHQNNAAKALTRQPHSIDQLVDVALRVTHIHRAWQYGQGHALDQPVMLFKCCHPIFDTVRTFRSDIDHAALLDLTLAPAPPQRHMQGEVGREERLAAV